MKLTNALRDHIAKSAAMDLFSKKLKEHHKAITKEIIDLVKGAYKGLDKEHAGVFAEYINWCNEIRFNSLSADWEATFYDSFGALCGVTSVCRFELPFAIPNKYNVPYLPDKYKKQVENILRPYMIEYLNAKKSFKEIKSVLQSLNTYKQVEESLPELAKYLPKTSLDSTTALVPIEQFNRVRALFHGVKE